MKLKGGHYVESYYIFVRVLKLRRVRVPILNPVQCQRWQQWVCEPYNGTMEGPKEEGGLV